MSRRSESAAILRLACQTTATNIKASSGASTTSSAHPAWRSRLRAVPVTVVMSTMPMPHGMGLAGQTRSQNSSAKQIEMTWNGIVSRLGHSAIAATLASRRASQARSSFAGPRRGRLSGGELISLTPDRLDELIAELGPQPPDAHAHDVGRRLVFIPPRRRQELPLGNRPAGVLHELLEDQELQPGQRQRPAADVGLHAPEVQPEVPGPDHLAGRVAAELVADPGDQLGERERLGQVVAGTEVEAVHLEPHLGEARQHQDRLLGPVAQQLPEHVAAVHAGHQQVKDDQVIGIRERSPQSVWAAARQLDRQALRRQRAAQARAYRLLIVDEQDTRAGGIAVQYNAHTNDTAQLTAGSTAGGDKYVPVPRAANVLMGAGGRRSSRS